jgi:hypothetical protein
MQISVNIQLFENETLDKSTDEIAAGVLAVVGGNEETDYCIVTVSQLVLPGTAGTPPVEKERHGMKEKEET